MGKESSAGVNDARSQSSMCTEAWYFWERISLSNRHLVIIISVLEAQVLDLNCCSLSPSCSSAFSTASYDHLSSSNLGTGHTLQKSAEAPQ